VAAVSETDELLRNAQTHAAGFDGAELPARPARRVAVVACMDARLNLHALLGLRDGDAHVIRNAGGAITDDEIRSLAISQRMLGTEEIVVINHTDCGMQSFSEDEFKRDLEAETGTAPHWDVETFDDLDEHVRRSLGRIRSSPFIPHKHSVRGFVYDVSTGALREVS
jgi:carbonic anhydrase